MASTRRIADLAGSEGRFEEPFFCPSVPICATGWEKRAFDLLIAIIGLTLGSPVFLLLAILAKLQSPGPILYRAVRVGRGGRPFVLYKFRSMVAAADRQGPGITAADDERITPIGRWLRRYRLDELPNLWNVLKGEMSLVGPRPELPRYVRHYTPEQLRVLSVRPGITGPTQLAFRHEEEMLRGQADPEQYYLEALLPKKLSSDLEYIATRTFWKDLGYLLATLGAIARELLSARRGSPQR